MKLSYILSSLALCACALCASAQEPAARTVLFDRNDMGSKFWRIPAIAVSNNGTVIAVADKRNDSNRDLPNKIDIAVRRSNDNGLTWSQPEYVIKADEGGGYGDPALGIHRPSGDVIIVAAHGNGLWEATAEDHQHVVVLRSSDNGATWSEPLDITAQLYDPIDSISPIKAVSGFASSGALMCDDNGRLGFVLVANTTDIKWGPLYCYFVYSDDGGYNWNVADWIVDNYGDESKVAQLADGSYLMSIRNRNKSGRRISRSADRGQTWTEPRATNQLIDPACNGDLIAISKAELEAIGIDGYPQGLLLHSLANDPAERRNVSVFASDDLGVNWKKIYTVTPDRSSYSALTLLPDGDLGIFSEEDHPEGGFKLWFTKVNLKSLLEE